MIDPGWITSEAIENPNFNAGITATQNARGQQIPSYRDDYAIGLLAFLVVHREGYA